MKHQINIDYGEARAARLEAAASAKGMTRPDYLRWLADGALAAAEAGREPFGPAQAQLTPADIAEHRQAVMEMARIAEEWARRAAALRKEERGDQQRLAKARAELVAGIPERMKEALDPFRAELDGLATRIDAHPRLDSIAAEQAALRTAQETHATALQHHTDALAEAMREPRTQYALVLGDDRVWSAAFVTLWSGLMAVLGGTAALLGFG